MGSEMCIRDSNVIVPTNSTATCSKLQQALLDTYRIQIYVLSTAHVPCYLRPHAQIYLEISDYETLARAVLEILHSVEGNAIGEGGGEGKNEVVEVEGLKD